MVLGTKKPGPSTKRGKGLRGSSGASENVANMEKIASLIRFCTLRCFYRDFLAIRVVGNSLKHINIKDTELLIISSACC